MQKRSLRFWIGIVLLVTNQPLGWIGMALATYLAIKTGKKGFYAAVGGTIYAFSWWLVFFGGYLAGPEGVALIKNFINKILQKLTYKSKV